MSTRIPVTIEGNLTADPTHGTSESGVEYAKLRVAVNDRNFNKDTKQWEAGETVFHDVTAFREQARNIVDSVRKGDRVLVAGDMQFGQYTDKEGNTRSSRVIVADTVAVSLRFSTVEVDRSPKVTGPEAQATGPVAQPTTSSADLSR